MGRVVRRILPEIRTASWGGGSPGGSVEHAGMDQSKFHWETAWCDGLQELTVLPSGLDSARRESLRNSRGWTNSAKLISFLQLKSCVIIIAALALGCRTEATTSFSFDGNFVQANITTLQDASVISTNIVINADGADTSTNSSGRALYSIPVQLLDPSTNSVASFQTSFSFIILATNKSNKGDGFAFGFFPDATSIGDSGKFMGIFLNTTSSNTNANSPELLSSGFNRTFVVEFDTHQDNEFGDPSDNHVGVNWNSMVSRNITDLTASGIDLVGENISAWIEYSYPLRKLSIWIKTSPVNTAVDQPILEAGDLDLSQLLLPSMYVGFAGGIGAGVNESHTISSWTFNTTGLINSGSVVKAARSPLRRTMFKAILGASLGLLACLVAATAVAFYIIRRRRRRKSGIIHKKLSTTSSSPGSRQPLKDSLKLPNTRRGSLLSKPFSPLGALLSSQPFSPRASPHAKANISSPASLKLGSNRFSPRTSSKPFSPLGSKNPRTLSRTGSKRFTSTQELNAVSRFGPRRYTYRELKVATNGFKETLGKGGFGTVFKGHLPNNHDTPTPVAVKRVAADSEQGEREFLAEVTIIAGLNHRNLVQINGWCHEKGELLLVYDFMENGSLDKHLYETSPGDPLLPMDLRYQAVCQVASALTYLHEEAEHKVIHRDVKASNVLLDAKFNARLGDFGLARLCEHSNTDDTTVLAGTMGYLAPELLHTGKATTKTDVFSFGTLILEVMCGKRPLDCSRPEQQVLLGDWVWERFAAGRLLDTVDPRLTEQYDKTKMTTALQVALMCIHPDTACRPPIRFARQMLIGDLALPPMPNHKPTTSFGSLPLIAMEDLLLESMSTIAAAIENPNANQPTDNHPSAEFEAPWKIKVSRKDSPSDDSGCFSYEDPTGYDTTVN